MLLLKRQQELLSFGKRTQRSEIVFSVVLSELHGSRSHDAEASVFLQPGATFISRRPSSSLLFKNSSLPYWHINPNPPRLP